jgi:hypothetical protein
VKYLFLTWRSPRSDHQKVVLAAQFVGSSAFTVDRHEKPQLLPATSCFPLLLTLFRRLPLAFLLFERARARTLFGCLPQFAKRPLTHTLTLAALFNEVLVFHPAGLNEAFYARFDVWMDHLMSP